MAQSASSLPSIGQDLKKEVVVFNNIPLISEVHGVFIEGTLKDRQEGVIQISNRGLIDRNLVITSSPDDPKKGCLAYQSVISVDAGLTIGSIGLLIATDKRPKALYNS
jgi:hypothetical protein